MAVSGTGFASCYIPDDGAFRVAVAALHNAFVAAGMVQTADTGQVNPNTATRSGSANAGGYDIFRFNDAAQANFPLYVKVEYGQVSVSSFCVWVTVGTGTNGAGGITGVLLGRTQVYRNNNMLSNVGNGDVFSSHGDGYFSFAFGVRSPTETFFFAMDRLRDDNGNVDGSGIFCCYQQGQPVTYLTIGDGISDSSTFPAAVAPAGATGTVYQGVTYAIPLYPVLGYPRHPSLSAGLHAPPDVAASASYTVPMLGTPRTFRSLGTGSGQSAANGVRSWLPNVAVRYE